MLVTEDDDIRRVFRRLIETDRKIYVDCETDGLDRQRDSAVGLAIGDGEDDADGAVYIPWGHITPHPATDLELQPGQASLHTVQRAWDELVRKADPARWRLFNKPFDRQMIANALGHGVPWHDAAYDVYHLAYLVNENWEHKLKALGKTLLGIDPTEQAALEPLLGDIKNSGHARVPFEVEAPYAAQDVRLTRKLDDYLFPEVAAQGLERVLLLETSLMPVIEDMQNTGVLIDTDYMSEQLAQAQEETEQLRREFAALTGWDGSLTSPDQLKDLIYNTWRLKPGRLTNKGEPSTDKWALERLKQENPDRDREFTVLEKHAELQTLIETFFSRIPELVDVLGAVHTSYNQMVRTGRMSASRPNIQQIPARKGPIVRRGFLVRPSKSWLLVDYSQIELRVLAHYAQDEKMREAYERGEDIHQQTADLLGIERKIAKTVNFADVYGAGVAQLARQAGVSMGEAAQLKARKQRFYPGIKRFAYNATHLAESRGWVKTVSGRRRRFTEKHYRAGNAIVQGSAADVMKLAMVECWKALPEGSKLVMSIHDELVFETPAGTEQELFALVKPIMESAFRPPISVPLETTPSTTFSNWGDERERPEWLQ